MKLTFVLFLSLGIALSYPPPLFPMEGEPDTSYTDTLRAINCQAQAGSTVVVPIWLVNSFPVAGFEFRIVFDDSVLTPVGCGRDSRIDYFVNFVPQWGSDWYRIWGTASGLSQHNPPLSPGSDTLAFVSFLVDSHANKGKYLIRFEADPDHIPPMYNALTDTLYNMIFPACVAGTLKVENSGIADHSDPQLPTVFQLAQNYPNPFNRATEIRYFLRRSIYITLGVYNIRGALVKNLVKRVEGPGFHRVLWEGRNGWGEEVGSGIYIYRMETEELSHTKKMIFLK